MIETIWELDRNSISHPSKTKKHPLGHVEATQLAQANQQVPELLGYKSADLNLVIVSHGVTMRVFLMRWFKWTTEQFELLNNPQNCEVRVMQLRQGGEYSLLVHHTHDEPVQWGLSPEMIADQEWHKTAIRGQWYDPWCWTATSFFDHFEEEKDDDKCCKNSKSITHTLVNGNNGACM